MDEQAQQACACRHAQEMLDTLQDTLQFLESLRLPNDHPALKDRNDLARQVYLTIQRAMGTALEDDPFPTEDRYAVFHRTWWRNNPDWPNGLEPCPGRRTYLARNVSYTTARAMCDDWNSTHTPGRLSRKAEFQKEE